MCTTPGQSRRTGKEMRADDGQRQLCVSGDRLCFSLFLASHSFTLLQSNSLTNVPWRFTVQVVGGGGKVKEIVDGAGST